MLTQSSTIRFLTLHSVVVVCVVGGVVIEQTFDINRFHFKDAGFYSPFQQYDIIYIFRC